VPRPSPCRRVPPISASLAICAHFNIQPMRLKGLIDMTVEDKTF